MGSPVAEKVVQPAVKPSLLAYCPTMDLIALGTVDERVHVFRFNGQEVFSVTTREREENVTGITWKPNDGTYNAVGQSLAIAFSDNILCLASSRTGKVINRINCSQYSKSLICCIGWGTNIVDHDTSSDLFETLDSLAAGDHMAQDEQMNAKGLTPNLPRELASLQVENFLPRLSTLSSGGMDDDVFNSRSSLDTVFKHATLKEASFADVLVLGFEDGTIHLSIYDLFEIGSFSAKGLCLESTRCRAIMHCFNELSTTHSLLIHSSNASGDKLCLLPLDLRLLSHAGKYLSILASKATQMRNLLRYVHQAQIQLHAELKAALDLPRRFMSNIGEALTEKGDWTWDKAAYHMVVTGQCPDDVKEWLVDQLGERGHRRWDKAIVTGYESVRRLTHENLLPALERFMVLVSRLRGLSKFQVSNQYLGLSTRELDNVIDTVSCLQLVAHQILRICSLELRQFQAFSAWLQQEIDNQASGTSDHDGLENDVKIDYHYTLQYIRGAMMRTDLLHYLAVDPAAADAKLLDLDVGEGSMFGCYIEATKRLPTATPQPKRLPHLKSIIQHLDMQCNRLFQGIAETQRKAIRFGRVIDLVQGSYDMLDMRIVRQQAQSAEHFVQFVAVGDPSGSIDEIRIFRIPFLIENGMSTFQTVQCTRLGCGDWKLRDIRFIDDQEILIGLSSQKSSRLVIMEYQKPSAGNGLIYEDIDQTRHKTSIVHSDASQITENIWMELPGGVLWAPQRVEVNGRRGRRAACILAEDSFTYRIYDLDSREPLGNVAEKIALNGE